MRTNRNEYKLASDRGICITAIGLLTRMASSTRQDFLKSESIVSSRHGKDDIRLGLRLIDEEVLARLELARFPSAKE